MKILHAAGLFFAEEYGASPLPEGPRTEEVTQCES